MDFTAAQLLQNGLIVLPCVLMYFLLQRSKAAQHTASEQIDKAERELTQTLHRVQITLQENLQTTKADISEKITQNQLANQQLISDTVQRQMVDVRLQIELSFKQHAEGLTSHLKSISDNINNQLQQLTHQVNQQLTSGFEKTSITFMDVVKRLTIIDEAQKKITELSSHVISLQDVLVDKRSRGAFGEVQLSNLIANMIPASHYQMQYTLSNGKRADCILFLPGPSANLVIDAKFPLETYQKLITIEVGSIERKQ